VRVAIQSELYAAVSQEVLDHLRVNAATEQQGGTCVAEVVPTDEGEARFLEERLEVAVHHVLGVRRRSGRGGEYEAPIVVASTGLLLFPATGVPGGI
jgi:hypothetical protein